ncbi:MAG: hypothetical protein ACRCX4_14495 [Bacteroidales bacterium]
MIEKLIHLYNLDITKLSYINLSDVLYPPNIVQNHTIRCLKTGYIQDYTYRGYPTLGKVDKNLW